jgi:hypothetical protein
MTEGGGEEHYIAMISTFNKLTYEIQNILEIISFGHGYRHGGKRGKLVKSFMI